jgi:hypothetical protein
MLQGYDEPCRTRAGDSLAAKSEVLGLHYGTMNAMRQFTCSEMHELLTDACLSEEYLATDWIPSQALHCPYAPTTVRALVDAGHRHSVRNEQRRDGRVQHEPATEAQRPSVYRRGTTASGSRIRAGLLNQSSAGRDPSGSAGT